jgi:hypothetical protein
VVDRDREREIEREEERERNRESKKKGSTGLLLTMMDMGFNHTSKKSCSFSNKRRSARDKEAGLLVHHLDRSRNLARGTVLGLGSSCVLLSRTNAMGGDRC